MKKFLNKIINGNSFEIIKTLPDESVNCVVTSPPYWGLRDYGTATWIGGDKRCSHKRDSKHSDKCSTGQKNLEGAIGDGIYKDICLRCGAKRIDEQFGLEKTPEEYVAKMVELFSEIKRVLKNDGTVWLNLGDSYASGKSRYSSKPHTLSGKDRGDSHNKKPDLYYHETLKDKDLIGIPWRVAFALQADGWYLRQDIIWHKPNPMPESVQDRCTKAHEYIFLLTKSAKYYFEPIMEIATGYDGRKDTLMKGSEKYQNGFYPTGVKTQSIALKGHERWKKKIHKSACTPGQQPHGKALKRMNGEGDPEYPARNKRSVWTVNTQPFSEAHFAVYPPELISDCIKAGCPVNGVVLDPFMGSGTTAYVARKLGRNYIGIELNGEYIKIANRRLEQRELPLMQVAL